MKLLCEHNIHNIDNRLQQLSENAHTDRLSIEQFSQCVDEIGHRIKRHDKIIDQYGDHMRLVLSCVQEDSLMQNGKNDNELAELKRKIDGLSQLVKTLTSEVVHLADKVCELAGTVAETKAVMQQSSTQTGRDILDVKNAITGITALSGIDETIRQTSTLSHQMLKLIKFVNDIDNKCQIRTENDEETKEKLLPIEYKLYLVNTEIKNIAALIGDSCLTD